jgi:hypothetical protein
VLWDVRRRVYLQWRVEVERLLSGGQFSLVTDRFWPGLHGNGRFQERTSCRSGRILPMPVSLALTPAGEVVWYQALVLGFSDPVQVRIQPSQLPTYRDGSKTRGMTYGGS